MNRIAADYLRSAILSGRLEPGERLNQDEIAKRLGVSRMPVREAMRILASEGLIELQPHRSGVVVSLRDTDISEIFGIRALLEARAVELATPKLTGAVLAQLRGAHDEMDDAMERQDAERWLRLNREFHRIIFSECGWPRLHALVEAQFNVLAPYLRMWGSALFAPTLIRTMPVLHADHKRILAAAEAGDSQEVARLTSKHVLTTSRHLATFLAGQTAAQRKGGTLKPDNGEVRGAASPQPRSRGKARQPATRRRRPQR